HPHFPFTRLSGSNPAPENAEFRHRCPITQVELFDQKKAWLVTKHADCRRILEGQDFSADRRQDGYPEIHKGGKVAALASEPTFVNLDDPAHFLQRNRIQPFFEKSAIDNLRPLIQSIVDQALDQMISKGCSSPVDLIRTLAAPVPTLTVYHMLGIPEEDMGKLALDPEVRSSTSRNAAENSNTNLQGYMKELTERKRVSPGDDLISGLIDQYNRGVGTLSEISSLAHLVLVAGNAAVTNTIALGILTLQQHPDQRAELIAHPGLAPQVVDEICRYQTTSALNCRRVALKDVMVRGQKIKKGEGIICAVQAADRDEEFFTDSDPETFDIHRKQDIKDVLGFGWGIHRCQAEWLSKAELEIVFGTLYKRLPNLKIAIPLDQLKYTPPTQNIGILELPVIWLLYLIPSDPQFARKMNSTPTPTPSSSSEESEITRLKLMFLNLCHHRELPLAPFYRWFVLHSIHKRNFKNGAFQATIPWIPSGPDAWNIEKILFALSDSSLMTDSERTLITTFLKEYYLQLKHEDKYPSNGLMPNSAWDLLKRMFDQNDPKHLAGRSWFNTVERHDTWTLPPYSPVEETCQDASASDTQDLEELRIARGFEAMEKIEKEYQEKVVQQGGTKRIASGSAVRSSSPSKKKRTDVKVAEVDDTCYVDSGVDLGF
ncbi:hypothetical protein DSL72_000235, partial [Monilinia vaccinii-corymbosi]